MSTVIRPLAEVTTEAIRVLTREMGVADTIRFINQFMPGTGNYTEERHTFLEDVSADEFLAEARRRFPRSS